MLSHCRALDLTDEKGFLCGKVLGDLGVDVIKVERPGGDPSRRIHHSGMISQTLKKFVLVCLQFK
jgi:crotonobetainyl-CoA:carnitine CoA-transferase CaiB-like acyl-CoA transferase